MASVLLVIKSALWSADARFVSLSGLILVVGIAVGPAADAVTVTGSANARQQLVLRLPTADVPVVADESGAWSYRWDTTNETPGVAELRLGSGSAPDATRKVVVGPAKDTIVVAIDSPTEGAVLQGTVTLSGWAIDRESTRGSGVASVDVHVDGATGPRVAAATLGLRRDDIAAIFGTDFELSGWTASVPSHALPPGQHRLIVVARSATGHHEEASVRAVIRDGARAEETAPPAPVAAFRDPAHDTAVWGSPIARVAGIAQALILIALMLTILALDPTTRYKVAQAMTAVGVLLGIAALALVDRMAAKAAAPRGLLDLLPAVDRELALSIAEMIGIRGTISLSTLAFQIAPAVIAATFFAMRAQVAWSRASWTGVAIVALTILLASGARVPLFAVAASSALLIPAFARSRVIPAYVAICLLTPTLAVLVGLDQSGSIDRRELWRAAIRLLAEQPLAVGFGVFSQLDVAAHHAHNTALQVLLDLGSLGFAALAALVILSARRGWFLLASRDVTVASLARLHAALLLCVLIAGTTDSVLVSPVPTMTYMVTVIWPIPLLILAMPLQKTGRSWA